eukprot:CAMPEP_0196728718 /NCGR_PEP_ID=MMETSP1091-20130531/9316_1 /TAXON_ID=302021 /ORGANISM="Rhodomonas sp., Strain CCMP768" /LENGTH=341 /DNA_ID=CAMNT_0042071505 /DNA_START=13 /DNA_END=1038 /DNA_ORIENTATION=+
MAKLIVCALLLLACASDAFIFQPGRFVLRGSPASRGSLAHRWPQTTRLRRPEQQSSSSLRMVVPDVGMVAAACILPPTFGLWRSEYTVSYGYGAAMFFSGFLFLLSGATPLGLAHALVVCLYGFRLNAFLLYRELTIERFQKLVEKIEDKANAKGDRLSRLPFILGCAFLYFCMAAPLFVTSQAGSSLAPMLFTGLAYVGFAFAAVGDLVKTAVKAKEGDDALVTSGPFALVRHPNYSGEMLLWTASLFAAIACAAIEGSLVTSAGWLLASVLGAIGINFVLVQATTGLEKRQAEKYGDPANPEYARYQEWVESSWKGVTFPPKPAASSAEGSESKPEASP